MKNMLMGACVLLLFSISLLIIQSCTKTEAQNSTSASQINKLIYVKMNSELWISNYDGTNATQINIALPPNVYVDLTVPRFSVKMSPDGQKLFFVGTNAVTTETSIFSCDISGNNVVQVVVGRNATSPILCGAY